MVMTTDGEKMVIKLCLFDNNSNFMITGIK
jgi:hypothetical protein